MGLLDIFYPKRCVSCGKMGRYFCRKCRGKIIYVDFDICPVCSRQAIDGMTHPGCKTRYSLDGLTSLFRYKGVIRQAVKSIKYRYISDLAEEFIDLIGPSPFSITMKKWIMGAVIIPIPLHSERLKFRGFNQAEVLGKFLAKKLNMPINNHFLIRIKKTIPQVEVQDRVKRLVNMENVFAVNRQIRIPEKVLLFDDVFTTGATFRSAGKVLKHAGVKKVWGLSLAHG
jgi:ComF family protein